MRPPVLPSGNTTGHVMTKTGTSRFNEAAGFTQRKHPLQYGQPHIGALQ